MPENMVRTQVYLPRDVYHRLQKRAEKHNLTLAVQIREALGSYLEQVEAQQDNGILHADDPIFKMIGMFDSGLGDLSVNHDYYLYGAPKRKSKELPVEAVKEKAVRRYRAGSKPTAKKRKPK